jgi:site-specific recombinase XerC
MKGRRDRAIIAVLLDCGLHRSEVATLNRSSEVYNGRAMAIKTCAKSAKMRQSWDSLASARVECDTLPRNPIW